MAEFNPEEALPLPEFEEPPKMLIVAAQFDREIAGLLVKGALRVLDAASACHEIVEVPGSLEIPPAIKFASRRDEYGGFVALGCVIRGETTHYETVCRESSQGLTMLGLAGHCIGNGILTVENRDQATERADPERLDKGGAAAVAALHLVALALKFSPGPKRMGFKVAPGHDW